MQLIRAAAIIGPALVALFPGSAMAYTDTQYVMLQKAWHACFSTVYAKPERPGFSSLQANCDKIRTNLTAAEAERAAALSTATAAAKETADTDAATLIDTIADQY